MVDPKTGKKYKEANIKKCDISKRHTSGQGNRYKTSTRKKSCKQSKKVVKNGGTMKYFYFQRKAQNLKKTWYQK